MENHTFTLSSYDPIEVVSPKLKIPEEIIDSEMMKALERYHFTRPIEPRLVEKEDSVFIALEVTQDGVSLSGLETDGSAYQLGVGLMPGDFDRQLVGMSVGETKKFQFIAPNLNATSGNPDEAVFDAKITIIELQDRIEPELNDAWFKEYLSDYGTVENYKEQTHNRMMMQLEPQQRMQDEVAITRALTDRLVEAIPDEFFEKGMNETYTVFRASLKQQGITEEEYCRQNGIDKHSLQMQILVQTRTRIAQEVALDAYGEHERIELQESDIQSVLPGDTTVEKEAVLGQIEAEGTLADFKRFALRSKALRQIIEGAKVSRF